jgi:hypothetical protein
VSVSDIQRAEHKSRARAAVMILAAVVFIINAAIDFGDPAYSTPGVRGAIWPLICLVWLFIVAFGGSLAPGRLRDLLNDELALRNRARATAIGFYATNIAAVGVYYTSWWVPMMMGDALQLVTGIGISSALLYYAWLELR